MQHKRKSSEGIEVRHARDCRSHEGGRCNCKPSYRAWVFDRRSGSKIRKTFPSHAAAKGWRSDALGIARRGGLAAPSRRTIRQAGDEWIEKAKRGERRNRSRQPYKPAVLRSYEADLRNYIYPDLGAVRLSDLRRGDVQSLVDRLIAQGLSGSSVRNKIVPLRRIVRDAITRDELIANPLVELDLPAPGGRRERAATPTEATELLAALSDDVRTIYAAAFYAGLRRGELRALRARDVDLEARTISVERGWDDREGPIATKSDAGKRTVPLLDALRPHLEPLVDAAPSPDALLFGRGGRPFEPVTVGAKAKAAWQSENAKRAEAELEPLNPIGLHEARHSFGTFLDHAGVSESRADRYMGHARHGV